MTKRIIRIFIKHSENTKSKQSKIILNPSISEYCLIWAINLLLQSKSQLNLQLSTISFSQYFFKHKFLSTSHLPNLVAGHQMTTITLRYASTVKKLSSFKMNDINLKKKKKTPHHLKLINISNYFKKVFNSKVFKKPIQVSN